jgi:hypothetical protein
VELPKKSFSRTVTEFAVIVLSVLVALGFESWRKDVEEHALELEYLERLKSEFHVDAARIATAIKASPFQQSRIDGADYRWFQHQARPAIGLHGFSQYRYNLFFFIATLLHLDSPQIEENLT